jgi:hypothetical protein
MYYRYHSMCDFIASYEDSKLLKRRINKVAEEEEEELELGKVEEQLLVTSK